MFVFGNKVSVTFAVGVTGQDVETVFEEDVDVGCVGGGGGGAAVVARVVSGGVSTVAGAMGFRSTGGEGDSGIAGVEVTGRAGGHAAAAAVLGGRDMEAWLWSGAGAGTSGLAVIEEFSSDCRMGKPWARAGAGVEVGSDATIV